MVRRVKPVLWFVVIALVLVAPMSQSAVVAQEKTVLTVWDWWAPADEPTQAFYDWIKTTFEARNPGVELRFEYYGFGEYVDKIVTSAASGVGPDVIAMSVLFAWDLWDQGVVADITRYVESDPEYQSDKFIPATQIYNRKDGHIIGTPWYIDTASLVYNVQHFRESALDDSPFSMETWDDFVDYAKKLVRYDGSDIVRAGYAMPGFPPAGFVGLQTYSAWLASNGRSFYNDDLTRVNFDNQAGIETLEFLSEMVHQSRIGNFDQGGFVFETGASMTDWHTGAGPYFLIANPNLEFRMTSFPKGPSGSDRGTISWGNMLAIMNGSNNQDLAWKYLSFASSLESNLAMLTILDRPTSPRLEFYQTDEWRISEVANEWFSTIPDIVMASGATTYPFWGEPVLTTDVAMQFYLSGHEGNVSPANAIGEAARLLNSALAAK